MCAHVCVCVGGCMYVHIHVGVVPAIPQGLSTLLLKIAFIWAGEMAQQLRALTALPEALSSIPSTHMVAPNHL